jgi:SAM-dependent methyltransferase
MIAFGIIERLPDVTVIFNDISQPLLNVCESIATDMGVLDRCRFVLAGTEDLGEIDADSVGAVTLRSVLIYVPDKAKAHREFFRVLRPGGRLSYFEPIQAIAPGHTDHSFWGYPTGSVGHLAAKVNEVFAAIQGPDDPMLNFSERDLVEHAASAGFDTVHLHVELRATRTLPPARRMTWEQWLGQAGNPKIPSIGEAIRQALSSTEREQFVHDRHEGLKVVGCSATYADTARLRFRHNRLHSELTTRD